MFDTTNFQPLLARRYTLEVRQQMAWYWQALVIALALVVGMLISAAILVSAGVPAGELLNEFVILTLFDSQSLRAGGYGSGLVKSAPRLATLARSRLRYAVWQ